MYFKTLANARKDFAWVTDPLMISFEKGIPSELMAAVGFTPDGRVMYKWPDNMGLVEILNRRMKL